MAMLWEAMVEETAVDWFGALGYSVEGGPDMSPGTNSVRYPLRATHADVLLTSGVHGALRGLNPELPHEALDDALRRLTRPVCVTVEARNRAFQRMPVDGVALEYRDADGTIRGAHPRVIDLGEPNANTSSAINQFTVSENGNTRRPDIVVFANGLPLAVIELKNPADENAAVWWAFHQLQTYNAQLRSLFACNAVLLASDGMQARLGTLSAGREWFKPWRTIGGQELAPAFYTELQIAIEGVLRSAASGENLSAAALQPDAQRVAETGGRYAGGRQPGGGPGDRRIGVVWHTYGSGKSLTMAFYAGRINRERAMANPTVVVLTDRNDLDDQLFDTFARCQDLLRQPPVKAASRADLRAKLAVQAGGVVFTTIQEFFPEEKGDRHPLLSDRRTSSSSPTRGIAASTISSTAMRATCAMRSQTHNSLGASGTTPPDGVGALEGWSRFLGLSPRGGV
jgi:type I restriction enzyme R subunit